MKIGVVAAIKEEIRVLVKRLQNDKKHLFLGSIYYTGTIGRHEVILLECGVGKVLSAVGVAILASKFGIDAIINMGSAGIIAPDLEIGDLVIADRLVYHDVDLTPFGYDYGQMAGQPLYFNSSRYFVSEVKKSLVDSDQKVKIGLIATGDSFIAGQDKVDAIRSHFPEVLAVEMEGAAIAQAAYVLGKPFLIIRSMSDHANYKANLTFRQFVEPAGERSARFLISFLEQLI